MTVYAFIPARAGSKRVPDKNWAPMLDGRSLVDIAVQCADIAGVDEIVVSTDRDVARDALPLGVKVHGRKPEHATDIAQIEDAIVDWGTARGLKDYDRVVLLQPTSPLRRPSTVRLCLETCWDGSSATVTLRRRWPFEHTYERGDDGAPSYARRSRWTSRPRSQDIDPLAEEDGCVYAFPWWHMRSSKDRVGPTFRAIDIPWWEAFEIDTPEDVEVVKALWPVFGGRP